MIIEATPMLGTIDADGAAGRIAAQGQAALMIGDTSTAKQKYSEAGAILEGKLAGASRTERDLVRFLAASQFYYAGEYKKALKFAERVEEARLPNSVRPLFPKFFRAVKERAAPGYAQTIRNALWKHWKANDLEAVNTLLQDHPYVIEPAGVSYMRVYICGKAGDYRASVAFALTAIRLRPDVEVEVVIAPFALLSDLLSQQRLNEAMEYSKYVAKELPHTVTYASASLIHCLAASATGDNRDLFNDAIRYYDQAQFAYQNLSVALRNDADIRALMSSAFQALQAAGRTAGPSRGFEPSELEKKQEQAAGRTAGPSRGFEPSEFEKKQQGDGIPQLSRPRKFTEQLLHPVGV